MSFYVSKSFPLVHSSLRHLENSQLDPKTNQLEIPTLGGIVPNVEYAWVAKGPDLEVLSTATGCKIGAWTFGGASREQDARIVTVDRIERPQGKMPLLAVGVNFSISGSMVCIFDPPTSKVIRTVQMREKVTSLHVIDPGSEISTIPGPLRTFDGIIAVGTTDGNVYLLDMCLQACEEDILNIDIARLRDEFLPCQMMSVNFPDFTRIEQLKSKSLKRGEHLGFHLNAVLDRSTEHFVLKGQDGEDRLHVNKDEVTVTALHFCPQLASLLVGYNFGAFQIWNFVTLQIVYTSPVCEDHIPITHFAIQEPVDDPRAFCYVWVAYSPETLYLKGFPYAVMYSLFYSKKEHLEDYGLVYKDFQSSMIRFEMELKHIDNRRTNCKPRGGQNLRLYSIYRGLGGRDCSTMYGNDDVLALCLAVWTVWCSDKETYTYATVFDLNQWYKEQMPRTPDWENCSNYLIHVCVSDLVNAKNTEAGPVLDVQLLKNSLSQFRGAQRLEEHFCSTSLIFDLCCLSEGGVTSIHNQSLQKTLLSQVELTGPLCLMKPDELYHQIISLGLVPLFVDVPYHGVDVSVGTQRSLVLDMALEQQLLGWLCKCASEWANGSFISIGCSLDSLLSWAYQRLITLKTNCDRLCTPLFDHSDLKLDTNAIRLLNCCCRQINNLSSLYTYILAKLAEFLPDSDLIEEQCHVVHNLSVYYEVLLWLFNMGLLPECPLTSYEYSMNKETVAVPYASENLTSYFLERRIMLKQLNKSRFSCDQSLLFIDNFLEVESGGASTQREWQKDGGSGFYPPSSLQALLRTYLVQQMSTIHKHMVLTYLFLDLAMSLNNPRYDHIIPQLIKFPTIFRVNLSMVKLTQAFWELDHGGFISALEQLLDPLILTEDFKPWHHKVALRSFLLQEQQNLALVYLQVRKPPVLDEEDILTTISLYVSNKMVDEAIYFQKQHEKQCGDQKLLLHLFNECNSYDSLGTLLNRALSPHEEEVLLKFLKTLGKDKMELIYFMMRSRYLEAFSKHEGVPKAHYNQLGLVGQANASATDYLVTCFKTLLPKVSTQLVDVCQRERTSLWQEVARPTPMSVFVHNASEKLHYKSTLINAALTKAKHTFSDSFLDSALKRNELVSEETPFLRTPTLFPCQKRKSVTTITPRIIDVEPDVTDHPPSAKKRKLTPTTVSPRRQAVISKLDTPVIKRRTSKDPHNASLNTPRITFTPQSILKVRELVRGKEMREGSLEPVCAEASYMGTIQPHLEDDDISIITPEKSKNSLRLSPRKSLPRTPRPAVHFEDSTVKNLSKLKNQTSVMSSPRSTRNTLSSRRSLLNTSPSKSQITADSPKTDSTTSEEFYSPDESFTGTPKDEPLFDVSNHHRFDISNVSHNTSTSVDDTYETEGRNATLKSSVIQERRRRDVKTPVKEVRTPTVDDSEQSLKDVNTSRQSRSVKSMEQEIEITESPKVKSTPKSRRGIKDSSTPIRSSPRLSRSSANNTFEETKEEPKEQTKQPLTLSTTSESVSPRSVNKIRGRKSLSRKVLETNAINRLLSSSMLDKDPTKGNLSSVEYSISRSETVSTSSVSGTSRDNSTSHYEVKYSDTYTGGESDSQFKHEHSEEQSFSHKKVSDETLSESTLTDSDISFSALEKTYEGPHMSDSILDYIKRRQNENNHSLSEQTSPKVREAKEHDEDDVQNNSVNNSHQKIFPGHSFTRSDRSDTLNHRQSVENHKSPSEQSVKTFLTKRKSINRRSGTHNNDVFQQIKSFSRDKSETTLGEKSVPDEPAAQQSRVSLGLSSYEDSDTSDVSLTLNKTYDGPQLSDSLINYIKEREEKQSHNSEHSHSSNNGVLHENNQEPSTETKASSPEVVVINDTPDDSEPMEVDEVDVYEGLSDDDAKADNEVVEAPVYEDISNSYVPCGDPEMNNFEYNKDLTHSSNTQMTREYVEDTSLGNVVERNVLGEDVLDEMTKSSSNSRQTDPVSSDEEETDVHEKGFVMDSDSLSNNSSKLSHQSNNAKQKTAPEASEVIEISSSDTSSRSASSTDLESDNILEVAFKDNAEDTSSEDSSDDRESIHLVLQDDSSEQLDGSNKVDLTEEEIVVTRDTKNGAPNVIEDKTATNTVNVSKIVDNDDKSEADVIMVDEIPVVMEEMVVEVTSEVTDDKAEPSSSLCEGYHNLVNEIFDENEVTFVEHGVKDQGEKKLAESSSNCQTHTVEVVPHKCEDTMTIGEAKVKTATTKATELKETETKNVQGNAEESLRSDEDFHLHLSEDTDESQEKLKETGVEAEATTDDAEPVKTVTGDGNLIIEDAKSDVGDMKTGKETSHSNTQSSDVCAKELSKNVEIPPTINDVVEKLGTNQQPYVKLRASDLLDDSHNDSKDDSSTPSHIRSSQRKSPSRLSLPVRRSRRLSASSRNEDDPLTPLAQVSTPTPALPEGGTPKGGPAPRRVRTRSMELNVPTTLSLTDSDKGESTPTMTKRLRAGSISQLPAIDEEKKEGKATSRTGKTRSVSAVDEYAVNRRLTRRQADMMQKTLNSTPKTIEEEEEMAAIEEMDPMQLLDKEPFEGKPDPDEQKVYEHSPPDSVETGSTQTRRTRRSASVTSDNSLAPSDPDVTTPKKRRTAQPKNSSKIGASPVASGVRTRSRTTSVDGESMVSQKSDSTVSPVNTRRQTKASSNADTESEVKSTRSRTKSVSSVRSGKSDNSKRSTRTRKQATSARSDLPEIPEER